MGAGDIKVRAPAERGPASLGEGLESSDPGKVARAAVNKMWQDCHQGAGAAVSCNENQIAKKFDDVWSQIKTNHPGWNFKDRQNLIDQMESDIDKRIQSEGGPRSQNAEFDQLLGIQVDLVGAREAEESAAQHRKSAAELGNLIKELERVQQHPK